MPHSTSPVQMLSDYLSEEDVVLPDAPGEAPGQSKEAGSMEMIDRASHSNCSISEATKTDVKLEDLFNDVDDDEDEFSGSAVSNINEKNISPDAPL